MSAAADPWFEKVGTFKLFCISTLLQTWVPHLSPVLGKVGHGPDTTLLILVLQITHPFAEARKDGAPSDYVKGGPPAPLRCASGSRDKGHPSGWKRDGQAYCWDTDAEGVRGGVTLVTT